jgi:hypothetical protein
MLSLAALVVVAGSVAAAQSLLWPSQRLADGKVNCFLATYGTGIASKTLAVGDVRPNGQLPISVCRRWYRLNRYRLNGRPTGLLVGDLPLVPCQQNATTVAVYVVTGQSDQCRRLSEKPLPATYAAAAARLRALQHTLVAVQAEHDCVSPNTLAKQARSVPAKPRLPAVARDHAAPRPGQGLAFRLRPPRRHGRDMRHVRDGQSAYIRRQHRHAASDRDRERCPAAVDRPQARPCRRRQRPQQHASTKAGLCATATAWRRTAGLRGRRAGTRAARRRSRRARGRTEGRRRSWPRR